MSTALLDAVVKKNRARLIPFMLALYVLAFLDRSNIGFAKQTYQIDTGLSNEAADPNALVMNFTADCWLEVTDATGKKLFSGMQRKDGNLNLVGQAPYKLKIGAPAAVQIQYQGKPVDLSRRRHVRFLPARI